MCKKTYNHLGFYLQKCRELKLNAEDLMILRWFLDFYPSMNKIIQNDKEYGWINYGYLIENLQILYCKEESVYVRMNKYINAKLLEKIVITTQKGKKAYFRATENLTYLLFTSHNDKNRVPHNDKNRVPHNDKNRDNSSTINSSTIDSKDNDSPPKEIKEIQLEDFKEVFNLYTSKHKSGITEIEKECKSKFQYFTKTGKFKDLTLNELKEKINNYLEYEKLCEEKQDYYKAVLFKNFLEKKYFEENWKEYIEKIKDKKKEIEKNLIDLIEEEKKDIIEKNNEKLLQKITILSNKWKKEKELIKKDGKEDDNKINKILFEKTESEFQDAINVFKSFKKDFVATKRYNELSSEEKNKITLAFDVFLKNTFIEVKEKDILHKIYLRSEFLNTSIAEVVSFIKSYSIKLKENYKDNVFWINNFIEFYIKEKDNLINYYELNLFDFSYYNKENEMNKKFIDKFIKFFRIKESFDY